MTKRSDKRRTKEQYAKEYQARKQRAISNGYKSLRDQTKARKAEKVKNQAIAENAAKEKSALDRLREQFGEDITLSTMLEDLPPDRQRVIDILIQRGVAGGHLTEQTLEDILRDSPETFWPSVRPYLDQTPEWR